MSNEIVQWNIRGYRANYEEVKEICQRKPAIICLQECMLGSYIPNFPRGYASDILSLNDDPLPGDGLVTLIRADVPYCKILLNTELQARAFRIKLKKEITICNIYINPNRNTSYISILDLINQLPTPFILMGDMNARDQRWGDHQKYFR